MSSQAQAQAVVAKLNALGVPCELDGVIEGPTVVRADIRPSGSSRMHDFRKISRADDLAFAIGRGPVTITAPATGRSVVSIEFPREDRETVTLEDLPPAQFPPTVPIGLDNERRPVLLMLQDAPHVLVAGQSGSGKTVALHGILCSLISALSPEQLQLVLIDLKRTELPSYEGVPHLAAPVADNAQDAIAQLHGLIEVQERRYALLQKLGARNLVEGNRALAARNLDPVGYVVCVVDELAELMLSSEKEIEPLLVRLAQKGRAAGIHLILATQTPRANVFTGLLSANVPTRIGFAVSKQIDSRVIMDRNGCENLLGKGDALFSFGGLPPVRLQTPYVSPEEVAEIVQRARQPKEVLV